MIRYIILPTITIGAGGTGSATTVSPIDGKILSVHLNFTSAGTPNTTISLAANGAIPARTLLTISSSGTDAWYQPRHVTHDPAAAAWEFGDDTNGFNVVEPVPHSGHITASVASGTENGTLVVVVIYEQ